MTKLQHIQEIENKYPADVVNGIMYDGSEKERDELRDDFERLADWAHFDDAYAKKVLFQIAYVVAAERLDTFFYYDLAGDEEG